MKKLRILLLAFALSVGTLIGGGTDGYATDTFKVLCQSKPNATTLTDCYTVPGSTSAVVTVITITNQSSVATSFRISVAVAGAGDTAKQYISYDVPIAGNETIVMPLGFGLATTDVVRVYNTLATLSFNVFGMEIS